MLTNIRILLSAHNSCNGIFIFAVAAAPDGVVRSEKEKLNLWALKRDLCSTVSRRQFNKLLSLSLGFPVADAYFCIHLRLPNAVGVVGLDVWIQRRNISRVVWQMHGGGGGRGKKNRRWGRRCENEEEEEDYSPNGIIHFRKLFLPRHAVFWLQLPAGVYGGSQLLAVLERMRGKLWKWIWKPDSHWTGEKAAAGAAAAGEWADKNKRKRKS